MYTRSLRDALPILVSDREDLGDLLLRLEREEVRHVLAAGIPATLGKFVTLRPVHPAEVGEEQQPVVGGGGEEVVDDVVLSQLRTAHAFAEVVLCAVGVGSGAFGVAADGKCADIVLFGNVTLAALFSDIHVDRRAL